MLVEVSISLVSILFGLLLGYACRSLIGRYIQQSLEAKGVQVLEDARREAKAMLKEMEIMVKTERLQAREAFDLSTEQKRREMAQIDERINQREANLDRKVALLDRKEDSIDRKLADLEERSAALESEREKLRETSQQSIEKLQRVSDMSREQARAELLERVERELQGETAALIRKLQEQARQTAGKDAVRMVAIAIQRYSGQHTNDLMTSTVTLPSEEMKGRIIGREGRNIRSLEMATGVNILIDEVPEAVVLTSFDPVRREVARQAIELLVGDGRIHPARIEEVVAEVEKSIAETIARAGEQAALDCGVQNAHPDLLKALGRLRFRSSFSQNVLNHSVEVAHLMGMMAGELGLDIATAKRVGLFHDIGKALDHEIEGGHATIGADLLRRCGELPEVVNGVEAHHEDVEATSPMALLASAADAISSARPGARSESTELYVKRLQDLEAIANSHAGVSKCYAIHAGREVRVFVEPSIVDESEQAVMARSISKRIQDELKFPGQIRVIVIRETRCMEYAR